MTMSLDNYYEILSIDTTADQESIRGAIRAQRRRYRQVAGSPNKERARNAEVMIEKIADAEATLLDPEARSAYDRQLASQPTTPDPEPTADQSSDWLESAKTYLANGNPRNAAKAAKQATLVEPGSVDAWTVRAYAALELHDHSDADFAASEAQKRAPSNPQIAGLLGEVHMEEENFVSAERAFARAAQLEPKNPYWRSRVAWAVSDQPGRSLGSVQMAHQVTVNFPGDEYARGTYAVMLLNDAEGALSSSGTRVMFTNPRQIDYVEKRLDVVQQMGVGAASVTQWHGELEGLLKRAKKRRFISPSLVQVGMLVVYLLCVTWFLLLICTAIFGEVLGSILWLGLNAALAYWSFVATFPLQWKITRRQAGAAATTGIQ